MKSWPESISAEKSITFDYHNVILDIDENRIEEWIYSVINQYEKKVGTLNFLFCDNEYIQQINNNHLSHDYATDIITFPLENGKISADIIISVEMVNDNATYYEQNHKVELRRVIIHGILHLIGFDDHVEEDKVAMRQAEDTALDMWK